MKCENLKMYDIDFDTYLSFSGFSYSGLKNIGKPAFKPTAKMQLGTMVHNYLLTPEAYHHNDGGIVKPIALALKNKIGPVISMLKPELAVTADFLHAGFKMPYKGRIDLCYPGALVIDIKVTEKINIEYFGYDKQLSGYALAIGAKAAIIVAVNPKNFKTDVYSIPIKSDWWEYQILQYGEVINN